MIYGYIRVSTDHQTTKNQKYEIQKFSERENISVDVWILETISGTADLQRRKLGKLLAEMTKNDILITTELSRLGRNLLQVMSILHYCMNQDIKIWTIKDNYRLGEDIQSKVLAFAFGLSAEIERNLISQRTREALCRIKSEGRKLGRPQGSRNTSLLLDTHYNDLRQRFFEGAPVSRLAQEFKVSRKTIYKYLISRGCTPPDFNE